MSIAHIERDIAEMITADGEPFEDGMAIIRWTLTRMREAHGGMSAGEIADTAVLWERYKEAAGDLA